MSKIYRILSTALIIAGLGFLGYYFIGQNFSSKIELFDKPSYYVVQNYKYVFLSGIFVLLFSLLGSFFSWFKAIEDKEEILPNAGYSSKKDISTWIEGTSLDTVHQINDTTVEGSIAVADKTELLEQTEVLSDEKTEVLPDEQTEILTEVQEVEQ